MFIDNILILLIRETKSKGLMKHVIMSDCDINRHDELGNTPLIEASKKKYNDIALLLIEKGADIHHRNSTIYGDNALTWSVFLGNILMTRHLLDRGCDINVQTHHQGNSLLIWSYRRTGVEMFELLLNRGADPTIHTKFGHTIFSICSCFAFERCLNKWKINMHNIIELIFKKSKRDFEVGNIKIIESFLY
jgi:ankyrin repeat protein